MKSVFRKILIALAVIISFSAAAEENDDYTKCLSIKDSSKRLNCYDTSAKLLVKIIQSRPSVEETRKLAEQKSAQDETLKIKAEKERVAARATQDATDVMKAVRRLQTKIQTGISYQNYSTAIADAKLEVTLFAESPSGKIYSEYSKTLSDVIKHYDIANSVWKIKISERYAWLTDQDVEARLMKLYPEIAQSKEKGVNLHIDTAVMMIWNAASKGIDEATKMLAKGTPS